MRRSVFRQYCLQESSLRVRQHAAAQRVVAVLLEGAASHWCGPGDPVAELGAAVEPKRGHTRAAPTRDVAASWAA
jgi:hypothetical protein